ncbi:hypothetical protein [Saccharothrix hoggarensis]|uniref:Uncharacterized protein n=1 Tax=Saccharothrix hoggarensis TaxID=913853 RepID=A0ABW3R586_9PSEU
MTARRDRAVRRIATFLLGLAWRRLPVDSRDEWLREWHGELSAILAPDGDRGWRRTARALLFALDQHRGIPALCESTWPRTLGKAALTSAVVTIAVSAAAVSPTFLGGSGYLVSGRDSGKISTAKNWVIYATLLGLVAYPVGWLLIGLGPVLVVAGVMVAVNLLLCATALTLTALARVRETLQRRASR